MPKMPTFSYFQENYAFIYHNTFRCIADGDSHYCNVVLECNKMIYQI